VAAGLQRNGHRAFGWAADGTRVANMEAKAPAILEALGGLDVLINCIGDAIPGEIAAPPGSDTRTISEADWHRVIDLNLTQAFVGCHVFGPHLLQQGSGCVINISSFAALRPGARMVAYASGKAGLMRFTESLALEWAGRGIRVNAIAPGSFPDPDQMSPEDFERRDADIGRRVPLGRAGRLREIGYAAAFLASDAAAYITGATLAVDGGQTLT
jgi:NAD(P)-dependent dehydrogenase (short-subunit alcohol dehydrogenase family)